MRTSEYRFVHPKLDDPPLEKRFLDENVTRMIRKDVNFLNALDDVYLASCLPKPAETLSMNYPEGRFPLNYTDLFETIRFDLEEEKLIYERQSKDRTPETLNYLYDLKKKWRDNPHSLEAMTYQMTLDSVRRENGGKEPSDAELLAEINRDHYAMHLVYRFKEVKYHMITVENSSLVVQFSPDYKTVIFNDAKFCASSDEKRFGLQIASRYGDKKFLYQS